MSRSLSRDTGDGPAQPRSIRTGVFLCSVTPSNPNRLLCGTNDSTPPLLSIPDQSGGVESLIGFAATSMVTSLGAGSRPAWRFPASIPAALSIWMKRERLNSGPENGDRRSPSSTGACDSRSEVRADGPSRSRRDPQAGHCSRAMVVSPQVEQVRTRLLRIRQATHPPPANRKGNSTITRVSPPTDRGSAVLQALERAAAARPTRSRPRECGAPSALKAGVAFDPPL